MKRKEISLAFLGLLVIMSAVGMAPATRAQSQPVLEIAVSIAPLAGLVNEVGGSYIETTIMLSEGIEPHAASLSPESVAAAEDADLLVLTGHFPWEEDLVEVVDTPYLTLDNNLALESYEDFGARLSEMPGDHAEGSLIAQHEHEGNPHAWWLLPGNAIAIANATRSAFSTLNASFSAIWQDNFDRFTEDVQAFLELVSSSDGDYSFSQMHAIVVTPAEAYIAEAFGIEVEAVLQVDQVLISGTELLEVQDAIRTGDVSLILGSDVARLQSGGEYAQQLAEDYDLPLVWCTAIFFEDLEDYIALMTYNLGALSAGLGAEGPGATGTTLNLALLMLSGVFGLVALVEAIILVQRGRAD
ncbi:MAG: metal ABC transporter substrate-binding protein [Candidatus Thorarchaeota archaeon]|jgi:ABC-type Zn uptake system ZnuABC Zn-binding protein ZnuA